MKTHPILFIVAICLLSLSCVVPVHAQSFEVLQSWNVATYYPITTLCKGNDGNFYGTTSLTSAPSNVGRGDGAVFQVTPQGVLKVLHVFPAGYYLTPSNALVQGSDGYLYGTTPEGEKTPEGQVSRAGTFYRVGTDGAFTSLLEFATTTSSRPSGALALGPDGNFYGVTSGGGTAGSGTFFKVTPAGQYTLLQNFTTTTGTDPRGRLLLASDGNFYGTTYSGGTNSRGTVFRATPAGAITVLANFPASGAGNPRGGVVRGADGNFYGLTSLVVFRVTPQGALTTRHTFTTATGSAPTGELVAGSDGNLYGGMVGGAANGHGGVFRLTMAGAYTLLHSFDSTMRTGNFVSVIESAPGVVARPTEGPDSSTAGGPQVNQSTGGAAPAIVFDFTASSSRIPSGQFIEADGGNLFSTTTFQYVTRFIQRSSGTVFRVTPAGEVTTLQDFPFLGPIGQAKSGLTKGTDGQLYGLSIGASANNGVAYKLPQSGSPVSIVKTFSEASEGREPTGQLVQAGDGNFYGATATGGSGGYGTVFKLTPAGDLTTIFSFDNGANGGVPTGTLARASNGHLFGATSQGGSSDRGTLFRVIPGATPTFAKVHTFTGTSNGQTPTGVLLAAADGNIYGTTRFGGTFSRGTVFRLTPAGVHSMFGNLGATTTANVPVGEIVRTSTGDIYGVTSEGGTGFGTVYRVSPAGVVSLLHSFTSTGPSTPRAGLCLGPDGLLYGTTAEGGTGGLGSIFKITTAGVITHFRHLDAATGDRPFQAPFRSSNGAIYGTTTNGGVAGGGTVYRVIVAPAAVTLTAADLRTNSATLRGTVTANGGATKVHFDYSTSPTFANNVITTPHVDAGIGGAAVLVSAAISGLTPGTVYYARLIAQNSGGTTTAGTVNFTTNTPPTGGLFTVTPGLAAPGATVQLAASGWTDPQTPLTYQFFLDGLPLAPPGASATMSLAAPLAPGVHGVTLRVFDARGDFTEASGILGVNNPPVVRASTLGAIGGSTAEIAVAKLLRYSSDPDGDAMQIIAVSPASAQGGTVALLNGVIHYTAPAGYSGPDSFTYTVRDASGSLATGTVNVTVAPGSGSALNVVSITQTAAGFLVRFAGIPGESYQIQYRDTQTAPWQMLNPPGAIVAGLNGIFEHEDQPNPKPASRFYRAVAP